MKTNQSTIISAFPGLASDEYFKITSDCTSKYNCIAWAAIKNDVFWWPDTRVSTIDGAAWPFALPLNTSLENFVALYTHLEYVVCNTWKYEDRFQKIALYVDENTGLVTHAARQNFDGIWTSKLGHNHDILHKDPFSLEGKRYGKATLFMMRGNTSYDVKKVKKFVQKA